MVEKVEYHEPVQDKLANIPLATLQKFAGNTHHNNDKQAIPHELINYLALVDWTSQQIHPNKRGFVNTAQPSILTKLNITEANWLEFSSRIEDDFNRAIGSSQQLQRYGLAAHKKRQCGMAHAKRYYATPAVLI